MAGQGRRKCTFACSAALRALAFEPGDRYPVGALRREVADAQRRRAPPTAVDLGDRVRARLTVS